MEPQSYEAPSHNKHIFFMIILIIIFSFGSGASAYYITTMSSSTQMKDQNTKISMLEESIAEQNAMLTKLEEANKTLQEEQDKKLQELAMKMEKEQKEEATANWTTLRNDKLSFSVKYPQGWPVKEPTAENCNDNTICEFVFGTLPTSQNDETAIDNLITLMVHSPSIISNNNGDGLENCTNIEQMNLPNSLVVEKKVCYLESPVPRQTIVYTFKQNNYWYQFISHNGPESMKVFDAMINTFRFTK